MMRSIRYAPLIGRTAVVSAATNAHLIGIAGRIIEETRETLVVRTLHGEKRVLKRQVTLTFPDEGVRVEGKLLFGRPDERIKRRRK